MPKSAPDVPTRWYCRAHKDLGEAWLAARTGKADGSTGGPSDGPMPVPLKQARFL